MLTSRRRPNLMEHAHQGRALYAQFSFRISLNILLFLTYLCCFPDMVSAHTAHPQELVKKHLKFQAAMNPASLAETTKIQKTRRDGEIAIAPQSQIFSLPKPLDSNIGTNFTQPSCEQFINDMLKDPDFEACHPVSLLLETSNSFFQATKSIPQLTQTLDAACSVDLAKCTASMAQYGNTILGSCMEDYQLLNPVVTQAYAGLVAYEPVYRATCMKAPDNGKYCYGTAVTNMTSPSSSYVYYLPLGMNLTSGAMPTCNNCLKQTMNVFSTYASNQSQPLSITYDSAAQLINIMCGPDFAPANVKVSHATSHHFQFLQLVLLVFVSTSSAYIVMR